LSRSDWIGFPVHGIMASDETGAFRSSSDRSIVIRENNSLPGQERESGDEHTGT
jgi:hypothetical protein